MSEAKVTVIMPVYNEEKYISYAIDSILAQTYTNWELIIVNDGSTDRTEEVVAGYTDSRIRYYAYEKNRGNPYAINWAMDNSDGEYILFFAGDDVAYPNLLKCQVEYLDSHPECVHVQGTMDYIDANGNVTKRKIEVKYKTDLEIRTFELYGNCIMGGSSLLRRDVVEKYGLKFKLEAIVSQDYLFWLDMLPYGQFCYIDEVVVQYRNDYGSNSHRIIAANKEWYDDFMRKILAYAWTQRGFNLDTEDIMLIYRYLLCKKLLWKPSDIGRVIKTYNKIKRQSKSLPLKEKKMIPHFFCMILRESYWNHVFYNRFIKKLREKRLNNS